MGLMAGPTRVLLVEDDPGVASHTVRGLRAAGFEIELVCTVSEARARLERFEPHCVVLDLGLPDGDGLQLIRRFRDHGCRSIVVTARTHLDARLESFACGADDYIPKPFFVAELVARIQQRVSNGHPKTWSWGELEVDPEGRTVRCGERTVPLTRTERMLFFHLVERRGRAVTREDLAAAVLGDEGDGRTLDSHVARLRRKLGAHAACLQTVWGIGYCFDPERS
jgi:DNA-binding response OmpR family regulator